VCAVANETRASALGPRPFAPQRFTGFFLPATATTTTNMTHGTHPMRSTKTGPKTRAVTDTPARSHPGGVTSANIRRTPATGVRAPAVHRRALATT
jgi:hypothetical protein